MVCLMPGLYELGVFNTGMNTIQLNNITDIIVQHFQTACQALKPENAPLAPAPLSWTRARGAGEVDLTCFREGLVNHGLCPREHHGWQRRG